MNDELLLKKLEEMETHLRNLDRRDRMRMIGSSLHTAVILGLLFMAIFGSIYVVRHFTDLVKAVAQESVKQTMESAGDSSSTFWQEMKGYFAR